MSEPASVFPAFLEMGLGVDLVGEDQTKVARRAVREAIGRTSLPGIVDLVPSGRRADMRVEVTVAVPRPEEVDADAVAGIGLYHFSPKRSRGVAPNRRRALWTP